MAVSLTNLLERELIEDISLAEESEDVEEPRAEALDVDIHDKKPRRKSDGKKSKNARKSSKYLPQLPDVEYAPDEHTISSNSLITAAVETTAVAKTPSVELPKIEAAAHISDNSVISPRQSIELPPAIICLPQFEHPSLAVLEPQLSPIEPPIVVSQSQRAENSEHVQDLKPIIETYTNDDNSELEEQKKGEIEIEEVPPLGEDHTSKDITLDQALSDQLNEVAGIVSWDLVAERQNEESHPNVLQILEELTNNLR